jgi:hypothetical protein
MSRRFVSVQPAELALTITFSQVVSRERFIVWRNETERGALQRRFFLNVARASWPVQVCVGAPFRVFILRTAKPESMSYSGRPARNSASR